MKEFESKKVIRIYKDLEDMGVRIWIDGGWAVDALLEKQTRSHKDLDIAVENKDMEKLKNYLVQHGFKEIEREEHKKWDGVYCNEIGQEIEIHSFEINSDGSIVEQNYWDGYDNNSLNGTGVIDGVVVHCVSLYQIRKTHDITKRQFKENDYADMKALNEKFKDSV